MQGCKGVTDHDTVADQGRAGRRLEKHIQQSDATYLYSSVYLPYTSELAMLTVDIFSCKTMLTAYPCKGLPATLRLVTVTLTLPLQNSRPPDAARRTPSVGGRNKE